MYDISSLTTQLNDFTEKKKKKYKEMYDELKEKETATTKFKDDILKFDNQFKYDEKTNFTKFVIVGMGPAYLLGSLSLLEK